DTAWCCSSRARTSTGCSRNRRRRPRTRPCGSTGRAASRGCRFPSSTDRRRWLNRPSAGCVARSVPFETGRSGMAVTHADSSAGNDVARAVFAGLPRRYDRLGYLLSFGQDRRWRNAVVDIIASAHPGRVLDVATGPAGVAIAVARRTTASVVGIDLNEPMLREGARNTRRAEVQHRVALVAGRAERLPFADES